MTTAGLRYVVLINYVENKVGNKSLAVIVWQCVHLFFYVIQPRSCITAGDNTSLQSLLISCSVILHRAGESDGNF